LAADYIVILSFLINNEFQLFTTNPDLFSWLWGLSLAGELSLALCWNLND